MDFALTANQEAIRDAVAEDLRALRRCLLAEEGSRGRLPADFHRALADAGWLGICIPEEYGGSGLGITEAAIMMRTIAESGAGMSGASAIHMNVFGLNPVVVFGTEEQQRRMLPPMVEGEEKACFAVTEPNTGLNTTQLKTRAVRQGDRYVVNGQKVWISHRAGRRQDPAAGAHDAAGGGEERRPQGFSLFYTDFDRSRIKVHEIEKMGRKAVDSNELFFENFEIPVEDRIGEEGRGFEYILHGMNPERILIAAEAVGLGHAGARARGRLCPGARRVQSSDRPEPGDPASAREELDGAGSRLADDALGGLAIRQGHAGGAAANAAKYLAGEAGFEACQQAVMTHGGFGYAKEFHVERYLREIMIPRIAPVSRELILSFIAEKVLGLPKSY